MKALYLLALVSAQAMAWPWRTVDDCTAKYVPKAESDQGAKIVRTACLDKYQRKIDNDGLFDCIVDKVVTAKTDTAASMMVQLCRRENPTPAVKTTPPDPAYMKRIEEYVTQHPESKYDAMDIYFYCKYGAGGMSPDAISYCLQFE